MTEAGPKRAPTPGGVGIEWGETDGASAREVREVFLALTRALRARQLYDPRNPVYRRFVDGLGEALRSLWSRVDRLDILVQEDRLLWLGEEVYRADGRADSLAFLLYRDGIRDLSFAPGIEEAEAETLLDALARVRTHKGEETLTTLLWDLDLQLLRYGAVDIGMEGLDLEAFGKVTPGSAAGIASASEELKREVLDGQGPGGPGEEVAQGSPEGRTEPEGIVRREDFNPTLYALDESELRRLRDELTREMARDVRMDTITALLDALEDGSGKVRQTEVLEVLQTILPSLLGQGELRSAATLVSEVRRLAEKGTLSQEGRVSVVALLDELSSSEAVAQLVRLIEDGSAAEAGEGLDQLLGALQPRALEALVRESEMAVSDAVRTLLRGAMVSIARANPGAVLGLLRSEDPVVAGGGVRLAARMGLEEAAGALAGLLGGGDPSVRLAAIDAAAELRSPLLAGALQRALRDGSREVRVAAARVLGTIGYPPAAPELRAILESREFRRADVTEKVACFEAYGRITGPEGVVFLDGVLNGKGFLGRREPSEVRAGAALALGQIQEAKARAALERARSDDDPVVRSAVGRALRIEGRGNG